MWLMAFTIAQSHAFNVRPEWWQEANSPFLLPSFLPPSLWTSLPFFLLLSFILQLAELLSTKSVTWGPSPSGLWESWETEGWEEKEAKASLSLLPSCFVATCQEAHPPTTTAPAHSPSSTAPDHPGSNNTLLSFVVNVWGVTSSNSSQILRILLTHIIPITLK